MTLVLISYILYLYFYGNDFFLLLYISSISIFLIYNYSEIKFSNYKVVISVLIFLEIISLGLISKKINYLEIDLLFSLGIILFFLSTNQKYFNFNLLNSIIFMLWFIYIFYYILVLLFPPFGDLYLRLRNYEGHSYLFI